MLALIIFLAVWGLVIGALARLALPGPDLNLSVTGKATEVWR